MSAVVWFELPAVDLDRAAAFYTAILDVPFDRVPEMPNSAMFNGGENGPHGELTVGPGYVPSTEGTLVYLSAPNGVADALGRVAGAGGKVLLDRTAIGEHGFVGHIIDTEGNRVGLHSME